MQQPGPGAVIADKYRLDELIGEGAMGAVFRATQLALDRPVAVKLMHPQYAMRADSRARFAREAKVAANLRHPNSIAVVDFGEDEGSLFLAMELLVGKPLRDVVDSKLPLLALPRAIAIAEQVASALVAAHRIQLVHRDIKPENIFLERDEVSEHGERVLVVDFGLAFIADNDQTAVGRLTQDGVLGGTPVYMSPEQAQGALIGPASDIYSLGCVIYEMVTGVAPFLGSVARILTRHVYESPVLPRDREEPVDIPIELNDLIGGMLRKTPGHRPTAEMVKQTLSQLAVGDGDRENRTAEDAFMADRSSRMIKVLGRPSQITATRIEPIGELELGDSGVPVAIVARAASADAAPDIGELLLGLAANGLAPREVASDADLSEFEAVYAISADAGALRALGATARPVVTDVEIGDIAQITALVRAGAAEVVTRPVHADELARKLQRAIRKHKQRHAAGD